MIELIYYCNNRYIKPIHFADLTLKLLNETNSDIYQSYKHRFC